MPITIWTYFSTPFMIGVTEKLIGTRVSGYEVIPLGKRKVGLLVKNPKKRLWHVAEEVCGGIVGTNSRKNRVIASVMEDVRVASGKVMIEQVKEGLVYRKRVAIIPPEDFFLAFKGELRWVLE
ncbi:TPA: hypothetical protein HA278_01145 [Candidatus Woesearchaeota archaeon]|nr:hypothetical protein [Candidatus Woesearchaeota archaeon]